MGGRGSRHAKQPMLLAPKQWVEATDKKHRYGGYLKHYWKAWMHSQTSQDFFYWLDYGEGRMMDHPKAPRLKLDASSVAYCSPEERKHYEVCVNDVGMLVYRLSGAGYVEVTKG